MADALRISARSYALRDRFQRRQYLGLGLLLAGFAATGVSRSFALGSTTGFYVFLASISLAVAGIALFAVYQGRVSRMLRVQVQLFYRQTTERRVIQQSLGGQTSPLPSVSLTLDEVAPDVPLALSANPGQPAAAPGRWANLLAAVPNPPLHFRREMKFRGEAGTRWQIQDSRGSLVAIVQVDRVMNRVFQFTVNDPTLVREFWQLRDPRGVALGRFVLEMRVDDRAERGLARLGFYDSDGSLIVRMEGGFATFPRTVPKLLEAFQGLRGFDRSSSTSPILAVAPGYQEGAFRLVDAGGATVGDAHRARPNDDRYWVVTIAPGLSAAKALLGCFAVAQWHPDGSNFALARMLSKDPALAARVDSELHGTAP
ncbi:MAG: hypothetical protein L3J87_02445 [Thermoplasmata archaeon]|nr:hypothetical protein [Thermoplasmata archaeon]